MALIGGNGTMKRFALGLVIAALLSGCSIATSSKIASITGNKYVDKDLKETLTDLDNKGFYCHRSTTEESDERLKELTDGTLNEVQFYYCYAEMDNFMGVTRSLTFMLSQYNKIIKINGNVPASTYLWQ